MACVADPPVLRSAPALRSGVGQGPLETRETVDEQLEELLGAIGCALELVRRAEAELRTGETVETEADAHAAMNEAEALLKLALKELEGV